VPGWRGKPIPACRRTKADAWRSELRRQPARDRHGEGPGLASQQDCPAR
jgi:hypothetical protein